MRNVYLTFCLVDAVGEKGRVCAKDIDQEISDYVSWQMPKIGYKNVSIILVHPQDRFLPKGVKDLNFNCNAYHRLNGRIATIDFN